MRAIMVDGPGEPEVLQCEEVPDPRPGPGQALVQLEAVGVNFIEVYQRKGWYRVAFPHTPGTEAAGTVLEVGDGNGAVHPGDRVAAVAFAGAYAERALAPVDALVPLPDGLGAREAAAAMLQGMTAHYLATSTYPLRAGQWCLVHAAAGGVGLLLCQIAARRGAQIIGTVSSQQKAGLAHQAGAHHVIVYTEQDFVAQVRHMTSGRGVQVVYDSVGAATVEGSLDSLAPRGTLVLFGQASGPVPSLDPQILNRKGSLYLTRPTLAHYVASREELLARAGDVLGWVRDGTLRLRIDREVKLANAADAHRALESRRTMGKILLIP